MKIVADSDIPYINGVLEPYAQVVYLKGDSISPADISDADALLVRTRTRCDRRLLEGSRVQLIATATIGFDHIDMEYCRSAGIGVATAAGCNARGVLQWFGAALVHVSQNQGWHPEEKTIGVVGVGNVGSLVADYAKHWGFRVLCCDPPRAAKGERPETGGEFSGFNTIAEKCDIITFHVPLIREGNEATFHMGAAGFFNRMKTGALIINSSRGEIIDTDTLLEAVNSGKCGCVIDTWENEPDINKNLLGAALLATPHIAGYSAQGKANASSMAVRAVSAGFGLPLTEWYPYDSVPKVIPAHISWEELRASIKSYYDIEAESIRLKSAPGGFESMRDGYRYRTEYF